MNGVPEGWGWPPNFRAYEYATVDSADGATVTLRGRLRHTYDEGWHDWEHSPLAGDVRRPDAIRREHEYLRGLSGRGASEASTKNLELSTTGNIEIQSRGNSFGGSTWGKVAYQLVFNRALSPAEVEQNRQALKSILAGRGITLP